MIIYLHINQNTFQNFNIRNNILDVSSPKFKVWWEQSWGGEAK